LKPPLEDRIRALRSEIDAVIDAKVTQEVAAHPNVSADVLRNILINRAPECPCRQYLRLLEQN
jgi:hypothetical protein